MVNLYRNEWNQEKEKEREMKAREEQQLREESLAKEREHKAKKKKKMIAGGVLVLLVIISATAFYFLTPGKYDRFAQCLTEKGAVMYGEDWCKYTNAQKNMFGKSFKYINYQIKKDLQKRPTWVIDGKTYENVQSFERLSTLTGCRI